MTEAQVQLLDAVHIDDDRAFIEFQFSDMAGKRQSIQIDFRYVESLAAVFQQAFLSAALSDQHGGNHPVGNEWLAIPRADIDHKVDVGVDVMSGRIVAMFLLGSPFQVCYSLPRDVAQVLSQDLQAAAGQAHLDDNLPRN
ncbi:MAG TPA: hypothetical protein VFG62_24605 [Rhodopila sp.]|jgi:hypothetical protein|nr:hypothetical protein [Rhodopila sp.]